MNCEFSSEFVHIAKSDKVCVTLALVVIAVDGLIAVGERENVFLFYFVVGAYLVAHLADAVIVVKHLSIGERFELTIRDVVAHLQAAAQHVLSLALDGLHGVARDVVVVVGVFGPLEVVLLVLCLWPVGVLPTFAQREAEMDANRLPRTAMAAVLLLRED